MGQIPHRQSVLGQKLFDKLEGVATVVDPPLQARTLGKRFSLGLQPGAREAGAAWERFQYERFNVPHLKG